MVRMLSCRYLITCSHSAASPFYRRVGFVNVWRCLIFNLPILICILIFDNTVCMFRLLLIVSVTLEANPFLAGAVIQLTFQHLISVFFCKSLQAFLKLLISTGEVSPAHTALTVMQVNHAFFVFLPYYAGF
jgi:hypothetical protein